jgi:hypothetical protein
MDEAINAQVRNQKRMFRKLMMNLHFHYVITVHEVLDLDENECLRYSNIA